MVKRYEKLTVLSSKKKVVNKLAKIRNTFKTVEIERAKPGGYYIVDFLSLAIVVWVSSTNLKNTKPQRPVAVSGLRIELTATSTF